MNTMDEIEQRMERGFDYPLGEIRTWDQIRSYKVSMTGAGISVDAGIAGIAGSRGDSCRASY